MACFLFSTGDQIVTVTSVETGDRVWKLDGGVGFEMASHPKGSVAIAARVVSGEVVLVVVDSGGVVTEIGEFSSGSVYGEFTASGYLFWVEEDPEEDALLWVWNPDNPEGKTTMEVTEDKGLEIVGTFGDAVVTVIEDDIGGVFELFTLQGEGRILAEFDDDVALSYIDGNYLYVVGSHTVAVVPLPSGTAVVSAEWDSIEARHVSEGILIAVGHERSARILLSFGIVHEEGTEVEYGEYDDVVSAQIYDDALYATMSDGSTVETLVFDLLSGNRQTYDFDYRGYRLAPTGERIPRQTVHVSGIEIRSFVGVSAGERHSCGVRTDNTIACWGSNEDWNGNYVGQAEAPEGEFLAVSTGERHSCGVRTDNTITCWGSNEDWNGNYVGQAEAPEGEFLAVSTGLRHSCGCVPITLLLAGAATRTGMGTTLGKRKHLRESSWRSAPAHGIRVGCLPIHYYLLGQQRGLEWELRWASGST